MNPIRKIQRKIYRRTSPQEDVGFSAYFRKFRTKGAVKGKFSGTRTGTIGTVAYLCNFMKADVPESVDGSAVIKNAAFAVKMIAPDSVVFLAGKTVDELKKTIVTSTERGAVAVFADKDDFLKTGLNSEDYPLVLVENSANMFTEFYRKYRDAYNGTVVGITGSVGKTTTKMLIRSVVMEKKNAFVSPANDNSSYNVADNILNRMTPVYDVFVQEIGAAKIGTIKTTASMLRPDIAVITNVKEHHLSAYKTIENVFADKIQMVEQLKDGGTAVVNFDDERLAEYEYNCKVASFGVYTEKDVAYRAINIEQEGGNLHMDIVHNNRTTHIQLQVAGEYNAYNVLAAFAVGKLVGISDNEIARGIQSFKAVGTRQNIVNYADCTLFVDCYNVANETIINSVKILEEIETLPGGRKIAIVGGENKLGEYRIQKTKELGEALADASIDEIICYGSSQDTEKAMNRFGDPVTLFYTIKEKGFKNVRLIRSFEEIAEYIKSEIKPGDAVLFKCIVYLNMPAAIDKALGTGFCLNQRTVTKKAEYKTINGYTGFKIADMDEAYLTDVSGELIKKKKIRIPDQFDGHDVFGLKKGLFMYSSAREIDFGTTIKHIGTGAFRGCNCLERIELPDSVLFIGNGAFRDCKKLREVAIGSGIRQINRGAFEGCTRLNKIKIKSNSVEIEKGAFPTSTAFEY